MGVALYLGIIQVVIFLQLKLSCCTKQTQKLLNYIHRLPGNMNGNDDESKKEDAVREEFIELRNFQLQISTGNPVLAGIVLVDNIRTLKVYKTPEWKVDIGHPIIQDTYLWVIFHWNLTHQMIQMLFCLTGPFLRKTQHSCHTSIAYVYISIQHPMLTACPDQLVTGRVGPGGTG